MRIAAVEVDATATGMRDVLARAGHTVEIHPGLAEFLDGVERTPPALSIFVGGRCGPAIGEAVAQLSRIAPDADIVVVCDRIDAGEARWLLAAGVGGLVLRREAAATIVVTVEAVRVGQICVPRRHARHVERAGLSSREKQVIGLVALGLSNTDIARRLFLAESTVKSHLSSAFGKLGVRSRNEAVELVINPVFGLGRGILSLGAEPIGEIEAEKIETP